MCPHSLGFHTAWLKPFFLRWAEAGRGGGWKVVTKNSAPSPASTTYHASTPPTYHSGSSPDPSYHPSIICVYHPPSTINPPVHASIHPSSIH